MRDRRALHLADRESRGLTITLSCMASGASTPGESSPRILLVDDEHSVQTLLAYPLRKDGYEVVPAFDGREALDRFAEQRFDLVVLDLMLPKLDGLEVCRRLRGRSQVPIIILTAKDDEGDKVLGLEIGADDYITKPFSVREFRSRVKAALRRSEMLRGRPASEPIVAGDLEIDFERRLATAWGEPVRLTYVEFELLASLARAPGRVMTREMLLEQVWGDSAYRDPRTIDVHIRHLREKLERDSRRPEYLLTVRGVGYRFRETE
jgi:DNA-binding response OmpR family regulator